MGNLPFLTLPDPKATGEGALDPLGLSVIGDRLAERILPGLRARMSRPRFLTAIAVCAAVCEGMEDEIAKDGVTPAYLVFEWLLVEAFVRCADRGVTRGTPGIQKAQAAKTENEVMCARTYLRVPSVFGFHGVYKPLAIHLGIIRDDLQLDDNGYALLEIWQDEQRLPGFLQSSVIGGAGKSMRESIRLAVQDSMRAGHSKRSAGWNGWQLLADHLTPATFGKREADFARGLLTRDTAEPRGEVFRLLKPVRGDLAESDVARTALLPRASTLLGERIRAVDAFETLGTLLEDAFDIVRYLSTMAGARAITSQDFEEEVLSRRLSKGLPRALLRAEEVLLEESPELQRTFGELARVFQRVANPLELFDAVLMRHNEVQKAKPPDGKRDWFERTPSGAAFVRTQYRLTEPVERTEHWNRPYRIDSARSFLADFAAAR